MVTKRVKFRGSALADRLGTLNNFQCDDEVNLKFNPIADAGTQEGVAENRFRISESIAPAWSKISIGYKKTAVYGHHDGTIEVYGLDNLGLETLLYQTKLNLTEAGLQNSTFIDMLRSSCTGAITKVDNENTIRNHMEMRMPKLREKYDDVSLQAAWYNSAWAYRKGIPINQSLDSKHGKTLYTVDTGKDAQYKVPQAYKDEYWYEVIYVTYDADMQADFGDLRFTGFDGVSPIEYWIIDKTDSTSATIMLRIPWFWGWKDNDRPLYLTNMGKDSGTGETPDQYKYANLDPKYIWMYYGNSAAANGTKTPVDGEDGVYYFDDFTSDTTSEWTVVGAAGVNSTFAWDNSSSIDMQINANNTDDGFYVYHELPDEISGTYGSYDIIWKIENKPATAGNYDAAVWIGSSVGSGTQPNNLYGLWISATDVYAAQIDGGVATSWTAGGLSFNHDDIEPYYIRARVAPDHQTQASAGITWEVSKDCRKWIQVVHLSYTTDLSVIPYSELTHFGMRMSAWAAAPAFNMELDTDWIMITQNHTMPGRGFEFQDHFEFSDFQYMWGGYNSAADNTYTLDYSNSEVDFAITGGSQIYSGGTDTAARIEISQFSAPQSLTIETRLDTHTRSTNGATRATLYAGTDANKHFNIAHQLHHTSQYNDVIYTWATYGGLNYEKNYQYYDKEPISEGPVWLRLLVDAQLYRIISQYSRDGYNWITTGMDSWNSFSDITDIGLVLQNDGSGNCTCSFDYMKITCGPYAANYGETFTAEQAYADYDDIAPDATIYYEYDDDFEDNAYTARTWPYRNYTDQGNGTATLKANTLGAETLADNQGQFETGVGGLTAGNCTITQSNTVAQAGTYSAKMVGTAQDSYGAPGGDYAAGTFRLSFAANTTWYFEGYVYPTSANHIEDVSYNRACRAVLFYRDSGGAIREVQSQGATTLNAWNQIKFRFTIPSGATAAALRLYNGVNGGTCYWDNCSLKSGHKPISGTYSLSHENADGADSSTSILTFEQPLKEYTATFKFAPWYDGSSGGSGIYYRLWLLRSAGDPDSFTCLDFVPNGATIIARVVNYHRRSGTAITNGVFRSVSGMLPMKEYDITVIDSGTNVTLYIDSTRVINNYAYSGGTNVSKVIPGTHSGFGSNFAWNAALWDDINIKPGYWYGGIQYTSPALTTAISKTVGDWQTFVDPENSYYFRMPTTYIRNQPMILAWKEQGQTTEWQYSKPFTANQGGVFYAGPNGLDKYIGMKTKIIFEGDDEDALEISDITYEYEV